MVSRVSLSKDQAKAQLNQCVQNGNVIYTGHFQKELANDKLTMSDVLTVCRSGLVIDEPEVDMRTGNWKYRIEGLNSDSERLAVVFAFGDSVNAVFITVFRRM